MCVQGPATLSKQIHALQHNCVKGMFACPNARFEDRYDWDIISLSMGHTAIMPSQSIW